MVDHIAHMVQNSSFYIQRKSYSEEHFHIHGKFITFNKAFLYSENFFYIQGNLVYSEKMYI